MASPIVHGIFGSPYTRSALLGLEAKAVAYEFVAIPLGAHKEPTHLARHPFARIPVLEHDGFCLYETQAILRYVDAVLPGAPLRPSDPRQAARLDQLAGIVDWYFRPQVTVKISRERVLMPLRGGTPDEAVIAAALPQAATCLRAISRLLGGGPFLAGEQPTIADLMLAPQFAYFAMTPESGQLLEPYPGLRDWLACMNARPSMQRTMPQ
jgi:glutathione S-transferase